MIHRESLWRTRTLGIAFFVVLALFIWFSISMYNKSFKDVVRVDLITDSVGNSLPKNADVKVRGVLVGDIRSTTTKDGKVTAVMAIDPDKAEKIPNNVTARLLPKTLFGERYVQLVIPDNPSPQTLDAQSVVQQDKSGNAVELSRLFDSVLPLLQAVPPQNLASTLGALSQALDGRGKPLGTTLDRLETIFSQVNTELPNLQEDLKGLADFSETYSDAAPQLINALDNLRTTNATIVSQRPQIDTLIASLTATGGSTADFLAANKDNIISLSADSKEALTYLATYSNSFGCVFRNFAQLRPRIDELLGQGKPDPGLRITVELTNGRGRYLPNQDEPRMLDTRGPWCMPEKPLGVDPGQYPGGSINDGSYQPPTRNPGNDNDVIQYPVPQFSVLPGGDKQASTIGSSAENRTLAAIYGAATDTAPQDVPGWTTKIGAPALRGSEVTIK